MQRKYLLTLGLTAMLGLTACQTVNTYEPRDQINPPTQLVDKRIVTDSTLNKKVFVTGIDHAEGSGGHLRVQAQVHNRTKRYRQFSYKFEWFDQDGILIESPTSGFIASQIEGGETKNLVSVAPTAAAKDFRLKLIENVR